MILSPNYTFPLILFYLAFGSILLLLFAIKTSSFLMGLILSLSIILIGSEYYEIPVFICAYLQIFGFTFPHPLSIINHALVILIFIILTSVAQIKLTTKNILALFSGPFLTALFIFGFKNIYLAKIFGLTILSFVTLEAISNKGIVANAIFDVKEYYRVGEHYDWVSDPRWLEKIFHKKREKDIVKLAKIYAVNSSFLDVGCGTGLITRNLQGNVLGLDINEWNLEKAKVNAPDAKFFLGDCEHMPCIASNSIDLVIFSDTLEHLSNPKKALKEIERVLKIGGVAIITVPSKSFIWHFRKYLTTTHPHSEPFHKNFSKENLLGLLRDFKILKSFKIVYGLEWIVVVEKI